MKIYQTLNCLSGIWLIASFTWHLYPKNLINIIENSILTWHCPLIFIILGLFWKIAKVNYLHSIHSMICWEMTKKKKKKYEITMQQVWNPKSKEEKEKNKWEIAQWVQPEHQFFHWFDEKKKLKELVHHPNLSFRVCVCEVLLKSLLCSSYFDAFCCLPAFLLLPFLCNSSQAKKRSLSLSSSSMEHHL